MDYGSSPSEGSALAMHTWSCSRIQSQVQVIQNDDSGSMKVFYSNANSVAFVFCFCLVSCLILVVSSFVASCTNDVD